MGALVECAPKPVSFARFEHTLVLYYAIGLMLV